ncbi:hypothetical protein CONPUDRAFT_158558 [Coniophora puteana RWD-64-598 SS2]|uniref:DUF6533 domain-containing protein n=1 Tax=Coniophora puteana (strain RWD-64-598) TaxID=741705 RepID=A0A5M3MA00_CONPW|nr:uncharacterized protein CONPUDRAFT_158558 [Coniophora puteana RWD-64-598 SS2]EIW75766.1 hypothetical protein CONPUDRAFT_158558 [Coniophora puteana RWD-64-598 SS2]
METPKEIATLTLDQRLNYTQVAMACLAAYAWVWDINREVELIWGKQQSAFSRLSYIVLRYGGVFMMMYVLRPKYLERVVVVD